MDKEKPECGAHWGWRAWPDTKGGSLKHTWRTLSNLYIRGWHTLVFVHRFYWKLQCLSAVFLDFFLTTRYQGLLRRGFKHHAHTHTPPMVNMPSTSEALWLGQHSIEIQMVRRRGPSATISPWACLGSGSRPGLHICPSSPLSLRWESLFKNSVLLKPYFAPRGERQQVTKLSKGCRASSEIWMYICKLEL